MKEFLERVVIFLGSKWREVREGGFYASLWVLYSWLLKKVIVFTDYSYASSYGAKEEVENVTMGWVISILCGILAVVLSYGIIKWLEAGWKKAGEIQSKRRGKR